jgi:hypothetical protein
MSHVLVVLCDEYTRKKEFSADAWRSLAPEVGQSTCPASTTPASPFTSASWHKR